MFKKNAILMVLLIGLSAGGLLAGCAAQSASGKPDDTTMITEAAQTVVAMLTQTAAVQPTATPTATASPTATATLASSPTLPKAPTAAPAAANAAVNSVTYSKCDMAGFVSDVTISDGTELDGGEEFTKTWELRNDGTCTWTSSYELVFYSGSQMDGADSQQLIDDGDTVAPGGVVDISVDLVAPSTTGTYIGYWILRNASAVNFGIGSNASPFYVKIVVGSDATATPTPTETSEYTATPTSTSAATATSVTVATEAPTATTAPTSTPGPTETPVPPTETPVPSETPSGS